MFCPDCNDEVAAVIEDNSFDHEFGTEWIFDYYCPNCERLLHTSRQRPHKEVEEP